MNKSRKDFGFTLLEVLMATILGGFIIAASVGFLFGVLNLSLKTKENRQIYRACK